MKSLLIYFAALTLSFNAFALEVEGKPAITRFEQRSSLVKTALKQENSPETFLANPIVNSHTIPQASNEKPNEFLTALGVYLIIIIVYSIYGSKTNTNNIRTKNPM
ncbi:MAG: hypothetical protein PHG00_12415 [Methylococcales bacterium]|nr:hypothetical protein [Methylococcales bacterium]